MWQVISLLVYLICLPHSYSHYISAEPRWTILLKATQRKSCSLNLPSLDPKTSCYYSINPPAQDPPPTKPSISPTITSTRHTSSIRAVLTQKAFKQRKIPKTLHGVASDISPGVFNLAYQSHSLYLDTEQSWQILLTTTLCKSCSPNLPSIDPKTSCYYSIKPPVVSESLAPSSSHDGPDFNSQPEDSAPIAMQSLRSTSSDSDSWFPLPGPDSSVGSSPNFNYLPSSFAQPDFRKYAQHFSNFMDDPFSGRDRPYCSADDVEHAFGGLVSSLAHNFQPSPSSQNYYIDGCLGMLDGQTLSEAPFVGFLRGIEDTHRPNFSNFLQAPLETGFTNHESSSTSLG